MAALKEVVGQQQRGQKEQLRNPLWEKVRFLSRGTGEKSLKGTIENEAIKDFEEPATQIFVSFGKFKDAL